MGFRLDRRKVEWVTARVIAESTLKEYKPYRHQVSGESGPIGKREIILSDGNTAKANVYRRENLGIGQKIMGPSIVEQIDTTTYIAPGWISEQQADGSLWVRRRK